MPFVPNMAWELGIRAPFVPKFQIWPGNWEFAHRLCQKSNMVWELGIRAPKFLSFGLGTGKSRTKFQIRSGKLVLRIVFVPIGSGH